MPAKGGAKKTAAAKRAARAAKAPSPTRHAAPAKAASKKTARVGAGGGGVVRKRWFKKMSHSDAQQKKTPRSNIKGIVTLGNERRRHPLDPKTYFRDVFFDNVTWTGTRVPKGVKEGADFDAEVIVHGMSMGARRFTVDHQTSRISNQNNVPTWLHWNDLGQYLRSNDHVGEYVSVERLANGTFRVVIDSDPTGPFLDA